MRALALLLAGLVALLPASCGAPRRQAQPALWRVDGAAGTAWLFGTVHLVPADLDWRTPAIRAAIASADTIVTEIPPESAQARAAAFLAMARRDGLPPIAARAADPAALVRAATLAGVSTAALDRMTTWGAALAIAAGAARGLGSDASPEDALAQDFAGKRTAAFETMRGQLALFAALAEADQRRLLDGAVADALDPSGYPRLLAAWAAGDEVTLVAITAQGFAGSPALERILLTDRNARWAARLADRLKRPGRLFVAVGAGHIGGPHGLVALLRRRGLPVARVR